MNTMPLFDKAVIIGPGLIGGSLGLAMKAESLADHVVGVGRRQCSLDAAIRVGAIDEGTLDANVAVGDADLVVLATAVGLAPRQAADLLPRMRSSAVVTDVGSVKRSICDAVAECFKDATKGVCFVGGHPLAGSEQRGVEAARADLFREAICILTPDRRTDPELKAARTVRSLWEAVGSRVLEMTPERHDRLLAQVSHLPHVVAAALVNAISDEALEIAGRGFLDTTRVASGDAGLWVDICLANQQQLSLALRAFSDETRTLADAVDRGDADAIRRLLEDARTRRNACLGDPP